MIEYCDEGEYEVTGDLKRTEDECGYDRLTVDGVIEMLQQISDAGHGDKIFMVSYDSGYAATIVHSHFEVDGRIVYVVGD